MYGCMADMQQNLSCGAYDELHDGCRRRMQFTVPKSLSRHASQIVPAGENSPCRRGSTYMLPADDGVFSSARPPEREDELMTYRGIGIIYVM